MGDLGVVDVHGKVSRIGVNNMTEQLDNPDIKLADEVAEFYDDPLGFVFYAFPCDQV